MKELKINKLADQFGQYAIILTCACGHERECFPRTLAGFAGWDANLNDVVRRLRCSKCGAKTCAARAIPLAKPRGLRDPR